MNSHPILFFADDDLDDTEMFTDAVKEVDSDLTCVTANNGQAAMQYLQNPENAIPDYIFLDLRMPRLSGRQCLELIKQDERLKNIPVIIYSTSTDERDARDLTEMGAVHFVSKPTNPSEIYYLVSQVINEKWK